MLYQLSYQANWEQVIVWVDDKLVDNGYIMGGVGGGGRFGRAGGNKQVRF